MAHARTICERKWTMFNGSKWWSRLWLGLIEKPLRFLFSVSLQRTGTVLRATWSSKCLRDSKLGFAFLGQEKYLDKIAVLLSYFIIGARCFCLRRWHFGGCNVDSHSHKPRGGKTQQTGHNLSSPRLFNSGQRLLTSVERPRIWRVVERVQRLIVVTRRAAFVQELNQSWSQLTKGMLYLAIHVSSFLCSGPPGCKFEQCLSEDFRRILK